MRRLFCGVSPHPQPFSRGEKGAEPWEEGGGWFWEDGRGWRALTDLGKMGAGGAPLHFGGWDEYFGDL